MITVSFVVTLQSTRLQLRPASCGPSALLLNREAIIRQLVPISLPSSLALPPPSKQHHPSSSPHYTNLTNISILIFVLLKHAMKKLLARNKILVFFLCVCVYSSTNRLETQHRRFHPLFEVV